MLLSSPTTPRYGLTGSVYSRETSRNLKRLVRREFHVGNLYLNRKSTGAMVGVLIRSAVSICQGTDSKAGGPDYLLQFVQAKSVAEKL